MSFASAPEDQSGSIVSSGLPGFSDSGWFNRESMDRKRERSFFLLSHSDSRSFLCFPVPTTYEGKLLCNSYRNEARKKGGEEEVKKKEGKEEKMELRNGMNKKDMERKLCLSVNLVIIETV